MPGLLVVAVLVVAGADVGLDEVGHDDLVFMFATCIMR